MPGASIKQALNQYACPKKAKLLAGFFKTGKGQYGEGDKFLGVMVPNQRAVAKKYFRLSTLADVVALVKSPYHEHRLTGLIILVLKFSRADEKNQKQIFDFYLKNTARINNWDLVDLTAPNIVGAWLLKQNCHSERKRRIYRQILYKLTKSKLLWDRRIAILATFAFIRAKQFTDSLKIAKMLLHDDHDLIHKAVGWMLREVGKRDRVTEEKFLQKYAARMPRTMLRYAIEKFPEKLRQKYLKNPS